MRVESLSCCFPIELVSFDPLHVTRSPPIENVFELGGITKVVYDFGVNVIKFGRYPRPTQGQQKGRV